MGGVGMRGLEGKTFLNYRIEHLIFPMLVWCCTLKYWWIKTLDFESVWYNKNMYLVSVPDFWHRTPKTLGIYCMVGASFVICTEPLAILDFILMWWLGGAADSFWMGLVACGSSHVIRGLGALSPSLIWRRGERLEIGSFTNIQRFNQSFLPMKLQ